MQEAIPVRGCGRSRLAWFMLAVLTLTASSGCAIFQGVRDYVEYNDTMNDFVLGYRNSVWARQAWHERKWQHVGEPQFYSFGEGFRDGYASVASGGNGCPPPLPPRKYWSWKYQSPEGQAKVAAWFSGYPFGAKAAEEDGAGLFQQIQVSYPIERQYSPEFNYSMGLPDPPAENIPAEKVPVPAPVDGLSDPGLPPLRSSEANEAAPIAPTADNASWRPEDFDAGRVVAASHWQPDSPPRGLQIPTFVPIRMPASKAN